MKHVLGFLVVMCVVFVGCGSPKSPSAEQIMAAVDSAVKKDSPNATTKLTDIGMANDGRAVVVKFSCTNCMLKAVDGPKNTVTSDKGTADVWLDPQDGKWKFQSVEVIDGTNLYTIDSLRGQKF